MMYFTSPGRCFSYFFNIGVYSTQVCLHGGHW